MKKLFSMKSEVKKFLIKHPVLRDNDNRLMANIWYNHIKNITFINGKDVLRMIATGKLPSPASITENSFFIFSPLIRNSLIIS